MTSPWRIASDNAQRSVARTRCRVDSPVTLRGVYYRVVSAGAVDKTELGYRLVGQRLLKLRRDHTVPYSAITDGTRWITKADSYTGLDQMLSDAAASYRRALWHDQSVEVEIFTEKDATPESSCR
ncbi:MAG: hypothetical protein ACRDRO_19745 [Pseudonocardiaceae bacterium]